MQKGFVVLILSVVFISPCCAQEYRRALMPFEGNALTLLHDDDHEVFSPDRSEPLTQVPTLVDQATNGQSRQVFRAVAQKFLLADLTSAKDLLSAFAFAGTSASSDELEGYWILLHMVLAEHYFAHNHLLNIVDASDAIYEALWACINKHRGTRYFVALIKKAIRNKKWTAFIGGSGVVLANLLISYLFKKQGVRQARSYTDESTGQLQRSVAQLQRTQDDQGDRLNEISRRVDETQAATSVQAGQIRDLATNVADALDQTDARLDGHERDIGLVAQNVAHTRQSLRDEDVRREAQVDMLARASERTRDRTTENRTHLQHMRSKVDTLEQEAVREECVGEAIERWSGHIGRSMNNIGDGLTGLAGGVDSCAGAYEHATRAYYSSYTAPVENLASAATRGAGEGLSGQHSARPAAQQAPVRRRAERRRRATAA